MNTKPASYEMGLHYQLLRSIPWDYLCNYLITFCSASNPLYKRRMILRHEMFMPHGQMFLVKSSPLQPFLWAGATARFTAFVVGIPDFDPTFLLQALTLLIWGVRYSLAGWSQSLCQLLMSSAKRHYQSLRISLHSQMVESHLEPDFQDQVAETVIMNLIRRLAAPVKTIRFLSVFLMPVP